MHSLTLSSLCCGFHKMFKTLLWDWALCWHDCITSLLQIFQLHTLMPPDPLFLPHPTGALLVTEKGLWSMPNRFCILTCCIITLKGLSVVRKHYSSSSLDRSHRKDFKSDFFSFHPIPAVSLCATSALPISRLHTDCAEACFTLLHPFIILFHYL